jgi:hypothetical protein
MGAAPIGVAMHPRFNPPPIARPGRIGVEKIDQQLFRIDAGSIIRSHLHAGEVAVHFKVVGGEVVY